MNLDYTSSGLTFKFVLTNQDELFRLKLMIWTFSF